jgi:hypothetical protein
MVLEATTQDEQASVLALGEGKRRPRVRPTPECVRLIVVARACPIQATDV